MNDMLVNVYLVLLVLLGVALAAMLVRAIAVAKRLGDMPTRAPADPVEPPPADPVEPSAPRHIGEAIEGVAKAVFELEDALVAFDAHTVGHPHCVSLRFATRLIHVHAPECPASKLTAGGPNIRSEPGVHMHPIPAVGRRRPPTPSDLN